MRTPDRDRSQAPPWPTLRDHLVARLPKLGAGGVDRMLAAGAFVGHDGEPIGAAVAYEPNMFIWFHRALRDEPKVPFEVEVRYRDERIVVVDKPHFLSSIPRGRHVIESVVVRARTSLDLPELGPAHRLDRLTAGLLLLTTERRWRAPYQRAFENRLVVKTYRALAPYRPELELPRTVRSHIVKVRGRMQADVVAGAPPNAETLVELGEVRGGWAAYRLTPRTGKTHQLRMHLNSLGIPIRNDPLYPEVVDVSIDDFTHPMQLIAHSLEFTDPVDGTPRRFVTHQKLTWPTESDRSRRPAPGAHK